MKLVWVVDDDEEMIQAVSLLMQLLDYSVKPFLSARRAADELLEFHPHLLLLDMNMPEVSGLDLLEFIRRREALDPLPVLMMSSEFSDVQVQNAMEKGADGFILKPFTLMELKKAIDQVFLVRDGN